MKRENKTVLAKKLNISRGMLYYQHRKPLLDGRVKASILKVLSRHPAYGHKRIALELRLNKKRILRIMKLYDLKPYRRRKTPSRPNDLSKAPTRFVNLVKNVCPIKTNVVWVGDFTWIVFEDKFYYLATVLDLYSREIIGWSLSKTHDSHLVREAFEEAVKNTGCLPVYFHSDQGSEYESDDSLQLLQSQGVIISMSRKSSPWENGYQESFYSHFKLELGDLSRFEDLGELFEAIAQAIYYYNHDRIHTKLKTSPVKFRENHDILVREYLYKELGT